MTETVSINNEQCLAVAGVRLGVVASGIKYPDRKDLVLLELSESTNTAAVFTRNAFCAAPVVVAKQHLEKRQPSHLLINTGYANAGTGEPGLRDSLACCHSLAQQVGCEVEQVLPFSTGVIGEALPVKVIQQALPELTESLSADSWRDAAEGIMTTDTRPKTASCEVKIAGHKVTITGMVKGAGMIKPNMATMLAYVATDAAIAPGLLEILVQEMTETSFNRISVDGDTSTNDACLLMATGESDLVVTESNCEILDAFKQVLQQVFINLAQQIIRDAEGATKFVAIQVSGGKTSQECLQVAYTVAESPLVKTALFASDPNWGRILAAVGRSGLESLDTNKVAIKLDDVLIAEKGGVADSYTEVQGQAIMNQQDIAIRIELNRGDCHETVWTSDLSHDYVKINAEYRT